MFKKALIIAAVVLAPVVTTSVASAQVAVDEPKVKICHANSNAKDPYVMNEPNRSAVDGQGNGDHYLEHNGPLVTSEAEAEQMKDDKIDWGDIIPPVEGYHAGLNWTDEGKAIYYNDCNFVTPEVPVDPEEPVVPETPVTPEEEGEVLGSQSNDAEAVRAMPNTGAAATAATIAVIAAGSVLMVAAAKTVISKFTR